MKAAEKRGYRNWNDKPAILRGFVKREQTLFTTRIGFGGRPLIERIRESSAARENAFALASMLPSPTADPRGDPPVVKEDPTKALESALLGALLHEPKSDERQEILQDFVDSVARIREFLHSRRETRLAEWRTKLDEVRKEGRVALDRWRRLCTECSSIRGFINAQIELCGKANVELLEAEARRPHPEDWPSEREIEEAETRIANARAKAERASETLSALRDELNAKENESEASQRRLHSLRAERDNLKALIAGKPTTGPFGLRVPAGR